MQVTVEVRAAEGVEVEFPDLTTVLEDLLIRDHSSIEARTAEDGTTTRRQTFELDSNLSGQRTISR